MAGKIVRIGGASAFFGDASVATPQLLEGGELDYIIYDYLAEVTMSVLARIRAKNPQAGYADHFVSVIMAENMAEMARRKVKVVANAGGVNPLACRAALQQLAASLGLELKIAAVTGDDVFEHVRKGDFAIDEGAKPVSSLGRRLVSANAYLGATPIVEALAGGADIVITGRVSDPALFLAPQIHELGWAMDDWTRLGRGIAVGHLLECAAQVTGGYFADPGYKDVPDIARVGFPIAEVAEDGSAVITKVPGSGGMVTRATCTEQLLYEIHDPMRYYQPDVVADFSKVTLTQDGHDRVRVAGAAGSPKTGALKVTVGYLDSFLGEGQISYAGPGALERGRLALEILLARLNSTGLRCREVRAELIGVDAILGPKLSSRQGEPNEVRVRLAAKTDSLDDAILVGNEVEALYLNGPAGGGGARSWAKEIIGVVSVLIPEHLARPAVHRMES